MPLTRPKLDGLTFEDLVAEMRSRIPTHAPEWTNHNPSDPGMTLLELFAFFGDALLYRVDRVSAANRRAFLRLLEGPAWSPQSDGDLDRATRKALLGLREITRAVTPRDMEHLALATDPAVARTIAIANRDLESGNPSYKAGHVSVVVVARDGGSGPLPDEDLIARIKARLDRRRILGTRIHVVPPRYVAISVCLEVIARSGADPDRIWARLKERLSDHLHPLRGGPGGTGWPLGRDVPVSDLYRLLDGVPGVDYVRRRVDPATKAPEDELVVSEPEAFRLERNELGELVAVRLRVGELVDFRIEESDIALSFPTDGAQA